MDSRTIPDEVLAVFLKALDDSDSDVQKAALQVLEGFTNKHISEVLIAHLNVEGLQDQIIEILKQLQEIPLSELVKATSDEDVIKRRGAVRALGEIVFSVNPSVLVKAADDSDSRVRVEALTGLGRIGAALVVQAGWEALKNNEILSTLVSASKDPSNAIRTAAVLALGEITRANGKSARAGL